MEVHALRRRGWSISAISRHLGRDRKTVRAYLLALREIVGLWSGWLVVGFMLGGVLGRRSFGGL